MEVFTVLLLGALEMFTGKSAGHAGVGVKTYSVLPTAVNTLCLICLG